MARGQAGLGNQVVLQAAQELRGKVVCRLDPRPTGVLSRACFVGIEDGALGASGPLGGDKAGCTAPGVWARAGGAGGGSLICLRGEVEGFWGQAGRAVRRAGRRWRVPAGQTVP